MLRCLRNCIAHGEFAVVDDYIIGFSKDKNVKKAILKIKPQLLLKALESLSSPMAKEALIAYAFQRIGYSIIPQSNRKSHFDLLLEKSSKYYAIEIKDYRGQSYLHPEHLQQFLSSTETLPPDTERVLFIDTSRVTKSVRDIEQKTENFRIIDLNQVKELLKDPPVDILAPNDATP